MCLLTLVFNSVKAEGLFSPLPASQPQEVTETLKLCHETPNGFFVIVDAAKKSSLLLSFGPELHLHS